MASIITDKNTVYNENTVYSFLKEVYIDDLRESVVNVFADARYKLYVNGVLVAVGPCRQSSEVKYYDKVDITGYLRLGNNKIEVKVLQLSNDMYNKGEGLLVSVMRTGHMGLCLWGNAGNVQLATDKDWLVAKENGLEFFYEPIFEMYNVAALYEKINTVRHKALDYDNAVEMQNIYDMDKESGHSSFIEFPVRERKIPMVYFRKKEFVGKRDSIYDAGELTCGYINLYCKGKGKVKITYAECMAFVENGKVVKRNRDDQNGVVIGSYDVLEIDGEYRFEPYWMRTFRYIEIQTEGNVEICSINYIETGYPIAVSDNYNFESDTDNKLFDISVNTLKRCMHETYMDCPYYEQLQYTMDTYLQIMYTYQITQDRALPEKAIDDFAKSYHLGYLTHSRYPANKIQYIPGFSLFFIMMLYEHSKRFGDKAFLKEYIYIADGVVNWFVKRLDGYMVPRSSLWDFIDWAEGYDRGQISTEEPIAVYSLMLAYTLEKLSQMHNMLGNEMHEYIILSDKIKKSVKEKCFDEKTGLYGDSPSKSHYAQHTQVWAVLCDIETGEKAKDILTKSMKLSCKVTSAYMFLLFRAFEKANMYEATETYIDSLRSLVGLGCTTTPEWVGEDVRSECHAWSAVAIYEFTAKVLGVTYKDGIINIEPYIIGRNFAKGDVATPVGMVYCEWRVEDKQFQITVKLPEGRTAHLKMPDNLVREVSSGKYICDI